jgi:hypothetical protein
LRKALPPAVARNYLLSTLQEQLYRDFYCPGGARPAAEIKKETEPLRGGTAWFVEQLLAANSGRGYLQQGWKVLDLKQGTALAGRGGLALLATAEEWRSPNGALEIGAELALSFPKELPAVSPGYYMAVGDAGPNDLSMSFLRLYWNVRAGGAVPLMRLLTTGLNEAHVRFRFKTLHDPDAYRRCDAAVLYIEESAFEVVAPIAAQVHDGVAQHMKSAVPALTLRLAPGLGLAEDTFGPESFGQRRCRILAEGIIRAHDLGMTKPSERLRTVAGCFDEHGVSLERPYLNQGSTSTEYRVPSAKYQVLSNEEPLGTPSQAQDHSVLGTSEAFVEVAATIGRRLCSTALWYEDRCNWIAAREEDSAANDGQVGLSYGTLGPRFYDGTAGIALFLAELAAQTGEAEAREAALGAMRNAFAMADAIPSAERLGLFTGLPGVALAAARVGSLLDSGEMLDGAGRLISGLESEWRANRGQDRHIEYPFDILTGSAGAIAALVVLSDILQRPGLLDLAVQLGDDLLLNAKEGRGGYSWTAFGAHGRPYKRNLTGLSHGAAGIAYVLLELWAVTGEQKYRQAAEAAFAYEQACFRPSEGNWPDFRQSGPPRYAVAWCHGAPGIALTRLRASRLLGSTELAEQANIALDTTAARLNAMPIQDLTNFCLCHGACGLAAILLASDWLQGDRTAAWKRLAYRVALEAMAAHASHESSWPCGLGREESPSFMLGTAGIGYFYLRLSNPSIPSMLLLQPEQFSPTS